MTNVYYNVRFIIHIELETLNSFNKAIAIDIDFEHSKVVEIFLLF